MHNYYDTLVCILHSFCYSSVSAAMYTLFGLSLSKPLLNRLLTKSSISLFLYVLAHTLIIPQWMELQRHTVVTSCRVHSFICLPSISATLKFKTCKFALQVASITRCVKGTLLADFLFISIFSTWWSDLLTSTVVGSNTEDQAVCSRLLFNMIVQSVQQIRLWPEIYSVPHEQSRKQHFNT